MQEGRFPRARTIGNRVCWVKSEIDDWLAKVPVKAYRDDADGVRLPDPFRHEKRRAAKKAAPKKAGA
jgi:Prophage CP4-57 regulatory protein (AlpA)